MSISFECQDCGKKYKVDDKLAGKRVACKGCGTSLLVPGDELAPVTPAMPAPARSKPIYALPSDESVESAADDTGDAPDFDTLVQQVKADTPRTPSRPAARRPARGPQGQTCPDCGAGMLPGTRLCINCGFDIRDGSKAKTQVSGGDGDGRVGGRKQPLALREQSSGHENAGLSRMGWSLAVIGILANLYPLAGLQLKYLMSLGASAPLIGCGIGVLGAILLFLARNVGGGVLAGSGVLVAFAVCMIVDPYAKGREEERLAAAGQSHSVSGGSNQADDAMQQWQRNNQAQVDAQRQRTEELAAQARAEAERRKAEWAAHNLQAIAGSTIPLIPNQIPMAPPRELPADPIDRDLFLLQQGTRFEKLGAANHLLAAPSKERIEQVADAFRALVTEPDAALRRLSIPGMLQVGNDANVPALITLLTDTNSEIRIASIKVLGKMRDERAVEPLINHLGSDTDEVIAALEPFTDRVESLLISRLKEGADKETKLGAIKGLLVFGTPAAIPALRVCAKDTEIAVATAAKGAWKKILPGDLDSFTEAMIDLDTDHSANVGLMHLAALKPDDERREAVVNVLTPLLTTGTKQVDMINVVSALVAWQGADAVPTLLPLLSGLEPIDRRQKIAKSLARTGDPRVATALVDWMTTGGDRVSAPPILASMGPAAEDAVLTLLSVDDAQLAPVTLGLLEQIGTAKSIRPLRMFSAKAQNLPLSRRAEQIAVNLDKKRLAELREQRLRPASAPATKPALKPAA